MIKTWNQRCEMHPDHQNGMVSERMIQSRMQEEIDDLRAALEQPQRKPLSDDEIALLYMSHTDRPLKAYWEFARAIEQAHGIGEKP